MTAAFLDLMPTNEVHIAAACQELRKVWRLRSGTPSRLIDVDNSVPDARRCSVGQCNIDLCKLDTGPAYRHCDRVMTASDSTSRWSG